MKKVREFVNITTGNNMWKHLINSINQYRRKREFLYWYKNNPREASRMSPDEYEATITRNYANMTTIICEGGIAIRN